MAAAFRLSYRYLDDTGRELFRRLGLPAGHDIDVHAAAVLADRPVRTTRRTLDALLDLHLLEQRIPDRYEFHDLIRGYAADLAHEEEPAADQRAAVERLLDHYTRHVAAAMELLAPGEVRHPAGGPARDGVGFTDSDQATAWLAAEHRNLLAAAGQALQSGLPGHTIALSDDLYRHLLNTSQHSDALTLHGMELAAARQSGDRPAEGRALRWLAASHHHVGENQVAAELCHQAITTFRAAGDRVGEFDTYTLAAGIQLYSGNFTAGHRQLEDALALDDGSGSIPSSHVARLLVLLAEYSAEAGDQELAIEHARHCLRISADLEPSIPARAWLSIGVDLRALRRYDEAIEALETSFRYYEQARRRTGQCLVVKELGANLRLLGRLDEAESRHREALAIASELQDRNPKVEAHRELGATLREIGRVDEAVHHLENALVLAEEVDQMLDVARGHDELAGPDSRRPRESRPCPRALAAGIRALHADRRPRCGAGPCSARRAGRGDALAEAGWVTPRVSASTFVGT